MKMKDQEEAIVTLKGQYATLTDGSSVDGPLSCTVKLEKFVKVRLRTMINQQRMDSTKAKETYEMDDEEKLAFATTVKDKGNTLFKEGKLSAAVSKYKRALSAVEHNTSMNQDNKRKASDIKKTCNLNLAAVYLKEGNFKEAKSACDKVRRLTKVKRQDDHDLHRPGHRHRWLQHEGAVPKSAGIHGAARVH